MAREAALDMVRRINEEKECAARAKRIAAGEEEVALPEFTADDLLPYWEREE